MLRQAILNKLIVNPSLRRFAYIAVLGAPSITRTTQQVTALFMSLRSAAGCRNWVGLQHRVSLQQVPCLDF
jgi:hypothetical protein